MTALYPVHVVSGARAELINDHDVIWEQAEGTWSVAPTLDAADWVADTGDGAPLMQSADYFRESLAGPQTFVKSVHFRAAPSHDTPTVLSSIDEAKIDAGRNAIIGFRAPRRDAGAGALLDRADLDFGPGRARTEVGR